MNLLHGDQFTHQGVNLLQGALFDFAGFGDEDMGRTDLPPLKALANVLLVDMLDAAAVFLIDDKLSVLHLQARFQVQEVGAERGNAGAASALPHELQRVQDKTRLDLAGQLAKVLGNLAGAHSPVTAIRALNGQQADAGGEHARIHHMDPAQLRRGHAGGVIGVGELRTDVQMDDGEALLRKL